MAVGSARRIRQANRHEMGEAVAGELRRSAPLWLQREVDSAMDDLRHQLKLERLPDPMLNGPLPPWVHVDRAADSVWWTPGGVGKGALPSEPPGRADWGTGTWADLRPGHAWQFDGIERSPSPTPDGGAVGGLHASQPSALACLVDDGPDRAAAPLSASGWDPTEQICRHTRDYSVTEAKGRGLAVRRLEDREARHGAWHAETAASLREGHGEAAEEQLRRRLRRLSADGGARRLHAQIGAAQRTMRRPLGDTTSHRHADGVDEQHGGSSHGQQQRAAPHAAGGGQSE